MKPILFCDFDGTICYDRYWRSLPPESHEAIQELLFRKDTSKVRDWMRGKYTAEEINQFAAEKIGMSYEKLWEVFVDDCKTMYVAKSTLEKLSSLRDKYFVMLLTGNMDSFTRFTVPALELEKYFDHISNSFYEGKHKTDDNGSLFVEYTKRFGAPIDQCIALDDNTNVCSIFESLGGKAMLITSDIDVDYHLSTL